MLSNNLLGIDPRSEYCSKEDFDIQTKAPVFDIPDIVFDPLFDACIPTISVDLRPPGHAWADLMLDHIERYVFGEFLYIERNFRARADQAHLALQYVEQLRQFVDAEFPKKPAKPCSARNLCLSTIRFPPPLFSCMLRNLYIWNKRLLRPTRCCLKMTGPWLESLIPIAATSISGDNRRMSTVPTRISAMRLIKGVPKVIQRIGAQIDQLGVSRGFRWPGGRE